MILKEGDLRRDEEILLKSHNYGFTALTTRFVPLSYYFGAAFRCTVLAEAVFALVLAAFLLRRRFLAVLCGCAALGLLGWQAAVVAVLAISMVAGKLHKREFRRAVLYWSWWPLATFLLCLAAAVFGSALGYHLWHSTLKQYYELAALQRYRYVDPACMPGEQVQDAGVVDFLGNLGEEVSIDRSKGGCLVNAGKTYCVAPIVHGGYVGMNLANSPRFGSFDYFAVGVDCCDCPVQDFKCGDWNDPFAHGGLRSMDYMSRPFFRLAVDSWTATYKKAAAHPLFFDWVRAPALRWHGKWLWVVHATVLVACGMVPATFIAAIALARWRRCLEERGLASPLGTPAPPRGLHRAWEVLLPEMVQQHLEEEKNSRTGLPAAGCGERDYSSFPPVPPGWQVVSTSTGAGAAFMVPPLPVVATVGCSTQQQQDPRASVQWVRVPDPLPRAGGPAAAETFLLRDLPHFTGFL